MDLFSRVRANWHRQQQTKKCSCLGRESDSQTPSAEFPGVLVEFEISETKSEWRPAVHDLTKFLQVCPECAAEITTAYLLIQVQLSKLRAFSGYVTAETVDSVTFTLKHVKDSK